MRYSTEFLNEKYKILPENIRKIANSLEIDGLIKMISEKHHLHIDMAEILYDEIIYVIFGAEKAINFIRNLKIQLKLPDEKINAIAKDANEKIFLPIREVMKNTQNIYSDTETEETNKSRTVKDEITQKEREIHYPDLPDLANFSLNKQDLDKTEESKDIKQYITKQQTTKPPALPPPNLPTDNLEAGSPNKKSYSQDPYRESIE